MKVAFVLHPGFVRSINDGQQHYISAPRLAEMYRLRPDQYVVYQPPRAFDRAASWRRDPYEGKTHLYPDATGTYTIPEPKS